MPRVPEPRPRRRRPPVARPWDVAGRATAIVLALLALFAPTRAGAADLVAALSNHLVAITTGFSGAQVLLFGTTSGVGDVVVVVRGPDAATIVRRKERTFGIWINQAEMVFPGVPGFYAFASSRPIGDILGEQTAALHQIGLDNLRLIADSRAGVAEIAAFRQALIRNKEESGLYAPVPGEVLFLGDRLFRTDLWIPHNAPNGYYTVSVFLVRDGEIASAEITPLLVSKVGLEARVFDFAHRRAVFYGLLAVVIAAAAGWAANVLLRKE